MEIIDIPSPSYEAAQTQNADVVTQGTPVETTTEPAPEQSEAPISEPATEPLRSEPAPPVAPPVLPEPDYTPAAILERYQGNEKALLQALGYDDFLISAIEYGKRTGGDLAAYWEAKHIDWNDRNRLPDEKVMELKLKEQYAQYQIPEAQVNKMVQRELRDTFKVGDDFDPEDEDVEMARLKLQMEAFKVRTEKAQLQAQFKAPELPQQEAPPPPEVVKAQHREMLLGDQSVQGFLQSKAVKFGDYTLPVENAEQSLAVLYDNDAYLHALTMRDAQGQPVFKDGAPVIDRAKQIKLALYAQNMERIEQELIGYGKTLGKKAVEEEAEVLPSRDGSSPSLQPTGDAIDALIRKMNGG